VSSPRSRKPKVTEKKREIPRPIHPFPARMAASIPWSELQGGKTSLRVLDPMAGSGTTAVVARQLGHIPIAFDTDPMAVLLAKVWCSDLPESLTLRTAEKVLERAKAYARKIPLGHAYPLDADPETRAFVRYWFDGTNRKQLTALAKAISGISNTRVRDVLWCAFSRMIITKQAGASLAWDVSHSRPHKVHGKNIIRPLNHFLNATRVVLAAAPFRSANRQSPPAVVERGDARSLPLRTRSVDVVISSPPYLNAIDYLRGHKFSLVWMGHAVRDLRAIRAGNIGTEASANQPEDAHIAQAMDSMGRLTPLPPTQKRWLARYVADMDQALSEMHRVLVPGGRAVLVIGDCTMRGVFVRNSNALAYLAARHGFRITARRRRRLPPNRRYLPPPSSRGAGAALGNRMRTEVLLSLKKRA
jgi:tRNA G10  N-methylase Trm11